MLCGIIDENYKTEYKRLERKEIEELIFSRKYYSINSDDEYIIFADKRVYKVENYMKIMPLITKLNKKLFSMMIKEKEKARMQYMYTEN